MTNADRSLYIREWKRKANYGYFLSDIVDSEEQLFVEPCSLLKVGKGLLGGEA